MPKNTKRITKRQRDVLDDLFTGRDNEQQVLEKHKISQRAYDKWLADANFAVEFERRLQNARRQGELLLARYSALAAAKLIELTQSQAQETARKACLDIITLLRPEPTKSLADAPACGELVESTELPPELAGRLLSALATGPPNEKTRQPAQ
jgi:hypothetical protein